MLGGAVRFAQELIPHLGVAMINGKRYINILKQSLSIIIG